VLTFTDVDCADVDGSLRIIFGGFRDSFLVDPSSIFFFYKNLYILVNKYVRACVRARVCTHLCVKKGMIYNLHFLFCRRHTYFNLVFFFLSYSFTFILFFTHRCMHTHVHARARDTHTFLCIDFFDLRQPWGGPRAIKKKKKRSDRSSVFDVWLLNIILREKEEYGRTRNECKYSSNKYNF